MPARLHLSVVAFADRSQLGINAAVRLLLERGLALEPEGRWVAGDQTAELRTLGQTALANLLASEEALVILEKTLNHAYNRIPDVDEQAAERARLRLQRLQAAVESEDPC